MNVCQVSLHINFTCTASVAEVSSSQGAEELWVTYAYLWGEGGATTRRTKFALPASDCGGGEHQNRCRIRAAALVLMRHSGLEEY
jgi:hypothetical protein